MSPGSISQRVILARIEFIRLALRRIRELPLHSLVEFQADSRNFAAAESHLRRSLEALFDLGRHLLAKGFGIPVESYRDVATRLQEQGVLSQPDGQLLVRLAGYRNRMVHFYHDVTEEELYEICANRLGDVETMVEELAHWIGNHSEMMDRSLD